MSREVKTISRAEPSINPKPMAIHIIDHTPEGKLLDKTLCGKLWDRFRGWGNLTNCESCQTEWNRRLRD